MPPAPSDERPRLIDGLRFEGTTQPGTFVCRKEDQRHALRKVDAVVAQACNGQRTLEEIRQFTERYGFNLSTEMVADVIRGLRGKGLISNGAGQNGSSPPT